MREYIAEVIGTEDVIKYWRKEKEKKSSSFSGLHFGNYIGARYSEILSKLHAKFFNLIVRTGIIVTRWTNILSVILEKIRGNISVDKLREILWIQIIIF